MCTVTYLPLKNNNFILTSNRDETPLRKTFAPKEYIEQGVALTFPKDAIAGGTWIGFSDKNRVVCLLNGGFVKHVRKDTYKVSRGVLVKQLLIVADALAYIKNYNFANIEPFTLIFVDWSNNLATYELVWDGITKHFIKLPQEPKIWSSSTLYTIQIKKLREQWFAQWLQENNQFSEAEILNFHKNDTLGDATISPKMKREFVETVSITVIKKIEDKLTMNYNDMLI